MLDKIKAFFSSLKSGFLYVVVPLATLAGYIYYLITSKEALQDKVDESDASKKLDETKLEQEKVDAQGNSSYDDYERIRNEYNKNNPGGKSS